MARHAIFDVALSNWLQAVGTDFANESGKTGVLPMCKVIILLYKPCFCHRLLNRHHRRLLFIIITFIFSLSFYLPLVGYAWMPVLQGSL